MRQSQPPWVSLAGNHLQGMVLSLIYIDNTTHLHSASVSLVQMPVLLAVTIQHSPSAAGQKAKEQPQHQGS